MFDKFDMWKYRANANCWDYVREFLIERGGVPAKDVPKYGIAPSNKEAMTGAALEVETAFFDSGPLDYAIACHYMGSTIIHVGVVFGGSVLHTSQQYGTIKSSIKDFERMCQKTVYKIHKSLCLN